MPEGQFRRLAVYAFVALVLVVEIVAARLIGPFVGVSFYSWTSIIGVILAATGRKKIIAAFAITTSYLVSPAAVSVPTSGKTYADTEPHDPGINDPVWLDVTTLADVNDGSAAGSGRSLRDANMQARSDSDPAQAYVIRLTGGETYHLAIPEADGFQGSVTGDLDLHNAVAISLFKVWAPSPRLSIPITWGIARCTSKVRRACCCEIS